MAIFVGPFFFWFRPIRCIEGSGGVVPRNTCVVSCTICLASTNKKKQMFKHAFNQPSPSPSPSSSSPSPIAPALFSQTLALAPPLPASRPRLSLAAARPHLPLPAPRLRPLSQPLAQPLALVLRSQPLALTPAPLAPLPAKSLLEQAYEIAEVKNVSTLSRKPLYLFFVDGEADDLEIHAMLQARTYTTHPICKRFPSYGH